MSDSPPPRPSFHVFHDETLIGTTSFESADAPMNVVWGDLRTTSSFEELRSIVHLAQKTAVDGGDASEEEAQARAHLDRHVRVRAEDGNELSPYSAMALTDWTALDSSESVELKLLGLDGAVFEKYFGHHRRDHLYAEGDPAVQERVHVTASDITTFPCGAIVNAANSALSGGGGVDRAIHRAAGPQLAKACRGLGPCPAGSAVRTAAFDLPSLYVIHAVGPAWGGGTSGEDESLRATYRAALDLAVDCDVFSVAFPAISCGAHRFPLDAAAEIAIDTCWSFLAEQKLEVHFCLPDAKVRRAFERALVRHAGPARG